MCSSDLISESTGLLVEQVDEIRERSERMEEMLGELTEIAGRTHLLSLNASIEAAHARQFGRASPWWPARSPSWLTAARR